MLNPAKQKEIIQNVLERKDSMAVLLMGFGKSMCYVLPPSHFGQGKIIYQSLPRVVGPYTLANLWQRLKSSLPLY